MVKGADCRRCLAVSAFQRHCFSTPSFGLLKESVLKHNKNADLKLIKKAYDFSEKAHKTQKRASGSPYFVHPFNTAYFLSTYGLRSKVISAALLHDVLEDTTVKESELRKEFGGEITGIVKSLTNLDVLVSKSKQQKKSRELQQMLFATAKDVRVVLIKLADKLHNICTLKYMPKEKQAAIAREAIEVYAPIAQKLGITDIEMALEEISFPMIYPEIFKKLDKKILAGRKRKEKEISALEERLKKKTIKEGIPVEFRRQNKTNHVIFQKMTKKLRSLDEINNLVVLVLVTNSTENCYRLLGLLHSLCSPIPKKMKDYIALPRSEFYQAIHTTVIGPKGKPVKIYIRTKKMDEMFHCGAITLLKKGRGKGEAVERKIRLLNKLLYLDSKNVSDHEFIKALKADFLTEHIFVFSITGRIVELPNESTPIDFAYAFDLESTERMAGARINGKLAPIWFPLSSGDIVEILKGTKKTVSKSWLNYVKTHKAREEILKSVKGKKESVKQKRTVVNFFISSRDRVGLLRDFATVFADLGINIISVSLGVDYSKETSASTYLVEVDNPSQINEAVKKLKEVEDTVKVETSPLG